MSLTGSKAAVIADVGGATSDDGDRIAKVQSMAFLEWLASAFGIAGAGLLALNNPAISGYGFVAFLLSNALWIKWGLSKRAFGFLTMQTGFTITSALGIWRWLC